MLHDICIGVNDPSIRDALTRNSRMELLLESYLDAVLLFWVLIIPINHDGVTELDGRHLMKVSLHHLPKFIGIIIVLSFAL